MSARSIVRPLLAALPLLAGLACAPTDDSAIGSGAPIAPIVLITIDTLRADHLGCYGCFRDTSPNLDRLAAEGVQFHNTITTMATTLPAHVSLFTSRYPAQTGVTTNGKKIKIQAAAGNRLRFFAEMLQDVGYRTAAFVSATPVKRYTGIHAGFEFFNEPDVKGRRANETTEKVLEWLDAAPADPFFLWIHYFDPHKPYHPPEEFNIFTEDDGLFDFLRSRKVPDPRDPKVVEANNLYDGEILFTDNQIERVFDKLRQIGVYEEATIVVTADHGEGLGQHDRIGHGEIHNEQLFVPLIIKLPEGHRWNGRSVEHLASTTDLLPTLTAALRLPISDTDRAQFTGVNALTTRPQREFALAQRTFGTPRKWGKGEKFALVALDWKFLYRTRPRRRARWRDQLFDMRTDPGESTNLIGVYPERAEALREQLLAEIAAHSTSDAGFVVIEETSPKIRAELRALGYLD